MTLEDGEPSPEACSPCDDSSASSEPRPGPIGRPWDSSPSNNLTNSAPSSSLRSRNSFSSSLSGSCVPSSQSVPLFVSRSLFLLLSSRRLVSTCLVSIYYHASFQNEGVALSTRTHAHNIGECRAYGTRARSVTKSPPYRNILVQMLNIVGERERPNLGFSRDVRVA